MAKKKKTESPNKLEIEVTSITVNIGKTSHIRVYVDGKEVSIPVDESLFMDWKHFFLDKRNTSDQKARFAILMKVVNAAYKKGLRDRTEKKV
ncbi:hypothetical protein [Lignipirellula cremea]|uniref:Uncharacterized protein n=1 Tax=Lignipirellula cremea TaxID=2528010 RepID=A0A518DQ20_9BACT|nr:hypothetical protein [Lignipirellula cremea]QDU93928.1 hypothetical protein Pla8534_17140 [Lignipirellula cremea]